MNRNSHPCRSRIATSFACLLLAPALAAQVPDGWYAWGSFQGTAGVNGIFFSHPRDPLQPIVTVTGLSPALAHDPAGRRGAACLLIRPGDGALVAGERSPPGTSVDLHVMRLNGANVVHDQLFSVGTCFNAGEIPQAALLPDGRIVVAATDLQAGGPLSQFLTTQYHWQGVGIVDTVSGSVTPIAIANLSAFPGVINGLAVSPDGNTVYIGNYISTTTGDLWSVPVTGGTATQMATFPSGPSNLAVDNDGKVLVVTLNGPPNLFVVDPATNQVTPVSTTTGPMNCIAVERVTGNYAVASANAGTPVRSLFWLEPNGTSHLLASPNMATISAIDVNPNPRAFGAGTPGTSTFDWVLSPNPGGMPFVDSPGFSITVTANNSSPSLAAIALSLGRSNPPVQLAGLAVHVDLAMAAITTMAFVSTATMPMPIPNLAALKGLQVNAQSFHMDLTTFVLGASPGLTLTVL